MTIEQKERGIGGQEMSDAKAVLEGLTKAQREVFKESCEQGAWFRDRRSEKSFVRKGLCEPPIFGSKARWTSLGLQVRALIEEQKV